MADKRRRQVPERKAPRRELEGLVPVTSLQRAREFAMRTLRDPGLESFELVLEVDIFQQWRASADAEASARALALADGARVFLAKLRELAKQEE